MTEKAETQVEIGRSFLVAGDVCLDVVGVPVPRPAAGVNPSQLNWKLTGEVRTHLLPGGSMLLAEFMKQAAPRSVVHGPRARWPAQLVPPPGHGAGSLLSTKEFLSIAERLTRQDIVHSLLSARPFPATSKKDEKKKVLRVERCHGYSGPDQSNPELEFSFAADNPAAVVVIDDTGNRFRQAPAKMAWPKELQATGPHKPLVVYKLHRPLPTEGGANALWDHLAEHHGANRVVILTVDELRKAGASISLGLSWERTALDVVWHLLNKGEFAQLRECPWLVIRLGLEGAVVLHRQAVPPMTDEEKDRAMKKAVESGRTFEPRPLWHHQAWLVYDPKGIEGSLSASVPGFMVACGSAFTAVLAAKLGSLAAVHFNSLLSGGPAWKPKPDAGDLQLLEAFVDAVAVALQEAQQVLVKGFGAVKEADEAKEPASPEYPEVTDAGKAKGTAFARHVIPIIPETETPDRNYWRILDSLFDGEPAWLHEAVSRVATGKISPVKDLSPSGGGPKPKAGSSTAQWVAWLLERAPRASYAKLQTYDRREIEQYRSLYTLLRDYLKNPAPERPLSFAVFGPPGAGKSFGVKQVAESLKGQHGCKDVKELTFNLSLYHTPEELAAAFHLVRDIALEGKVPLVFFDEFDTPLNREALGWLRNFLAPMQDGKFLDRGSEHPIGQAIFVFAGGTCGTYREFSAHTPMSADEFRAAKGPDFLSRLRATLDIPSLNLLTAEEPQPEKPGDPHSCRVQKPGTYNPYGPTEDFACRAAILLRRASILAFNLKKKAPGLERFDGSLDVDPSVLNALLFLPEFNHGNRSFEAILDMSHLADAEEFTPALLPPAAQLCLHADAATFQQMLSTQHLLSPGEREQLGQIIHEHYVTQRMAQVPPPAAGEDNLKPWPQLDPAYQNSSREQADDIADKLRKVGLWFRKVGPGRAPAPLQHHRWEAKIEALAKLEHDRFVAERRRKGWACAPSTAKIHRNDHLLLHNYLFPWSALDEKTRDLDRGPASEIPKLLTSIGYELYEA